MWFFLFILINTIMINEAQFDFDSIFEFLSNLEPPCNCKGSHCECCLNVFIIGQEGCLRVAIRNNRIRVSFIYNGDELGGISSRLGSPGVPNGFSFTIPCVPNTNFSARLKNSRNRNSRRFCVNLRATGQRRTVYNQDFCFDVNGNTLNFVNNSIG